MNDYSIDLETLSTRASAAIISIGIQQFDIDTGKLGQTFYREVDINSAIKGRHISGDTIAWWMQQDMKARDVFASKPSKVSMATALDEMCRWMGEHKGGFVRVWGNGATFDITILETAIQECAVGISIPWRFTYIRDMRTIVDAAEVDPNNWPFPKNGVAHNALHDATRQACVIAAAWMKIKRGLRAFEDTPSAPKPPVKRAADPAVVNPPLAPIIPDDEEL